MLNAETVNDSRVPLASSTKGVGTVYFGRHVFGLAAILFGIFTLSWRDFNVWEQIRPLGNVPHREILACVAGAVELLGGLAIQWRKTARVGAVALGGIFLIFALLWIPRGLAKPLAWDPWGNFFEQFSQVAGALIVYASFDRRHSLQAATITRFAYIAFGICVFAFFFGQFPATCKCDVRGLIPAWLPPGKMFWAVATTLAFPLASIALLSGRMALLASRLLTAMIMGFGVLVWLPAPFMHPFADQHINWAGNAENLAIGGAAWIVADLLSRKREAAKARARGSGSSSTDSVYPEYC
jgi:uncharacterized membrane protein YphA (DoxX/SURF4 family)